MNKVKNSSKEDQEIVVNIFFYLPFLVILFNAASQSILLNSLFGTKDHSGAAIWFPPNYVVEFDAIGETLKDLP
ncbi:hypothetical protein N9450_00820 [Gammaproteobacteria bacterium]|nr:hypothetical protein [Gammaproteobacteria bacterium]